jgi:alpha-mannosidase
MTPTVVIVSHTHWDREWYQPFEVFRLRLAEMVAALLDLLDGEARYRHFMLDGQTVCLEDVLEVRPELDARLCSHIASGRISVGPWYVLQDEFLVGAEAIVRNLHEGLRSAGRPMMIGYLPDAFGHIAQMPRILRGFGIDTAVVWRGVGEGAPGSEWRWRAASGAEVLCLFLPGGYGNAHGIGRDEEGARDRLRTDLQTVLPLSRAALLLWMNGNDHQPAEPALPAVLDALRRAHPDVAFEHASLERAAEIVRERVDVGALGVVAGELRRATPTVPVLSGTWSSRSWQKRDHDAAQALLSRFAEPLVAWAGQDRREALAHAWRQLLKCQPHDSICGCSIDEVHRDIDARLRGVVEMGRALVRDAVEALLSAPTGDFALHQSIAIVNPHPFVATGMVEVDLQRRIEDGPFRLRTESGEAAYEIVSRSPTDGPDGRPAEWLRLRIEACDLLPHGLRVLALEPGSPAPPATPALLKVRTIAGGIEITDESGLSIVHTFEDEDDLGDLYDFCPREGSPRRSSRAHDFGVEIFARAIGRRVEIDVTIENRSPDHRLRARFDLSTPPTSLWTETAFGWLPRTTPGTHPVAGITLAPPVAIGGLGLHEVERGDDGAIFLTLFRAVGWMSRGDLSTRPGHAGFNVQTPEAQGIGRLRFRYVVAVGDEAAREIAAGLIPPRAVALGHAQPPSIERPFLAVEPPSVRLSICKRAHDGEGLVVRLCGPPDAAVTARVRLFRPIARAFWSDLDERMGDAIDVAGDELAVPIAANDVVTLYLVVR